ncbi:5189_t:CDS:2, partial [Gigaspora rosea]
RKLVVKEKIRGKEKISDKKKYQSQILWMIITAFILIVGIANLKIDMIVESFKSSFFDEPLQSFNQTRNCSSSKSRC